MSNGHISVQSIELLHRGGKGQWGMYGYRYLGSATLGGGMGVLTWAYYRAENKSALFLDLFAKAGFPGFK